MDTNEGTPSGFRRGAFSLELRGNGPRHLCSGAEVTDRSAPDWVDVEVSDWELGERHRRRFWARLSGRPDDVRVEVELAPDLSWVATGRRLSDGVPRPGGRIVIDVELPPSLFEGSDRPADHPMRSSARLSGSIERPIPAPDAPPTMAEELCEVVGADGARRTGPYVSINVELGGVPRLADLQPELREGWRLFLSDWTADWSRVTISAAPAKTDLDVLRWIPTEAINHRLTAEDILTRLRAIRSRWPFVVLGASPDSVLLELLEPVTDDPRALAQQLWDLCPDLDQCGFRDPDHLAAHVAERPPSVTRHLLELWWD